MSKVIVHSFLPAPGLGGGIGGFDWGHKGTPAEDAVRAQYELDADATHRDYTPSHIHRLLEVDVHRSLTPNEVTDFIEEELLDQIERGDLDPTPALLAKHEPTINTEGGRQ